MGLSHHDSAYDEMKQEFIKETDRWLGTLLSEEDVPFLIDRLFSIMNNYGAVEWT